MASNSQYSGELKKKNLIAFKYDVKNPSLLDTAEYKTTILKKTEKAT